MIIVVYANHLHFIQKLCKRIDDCTGKQEVRTQATLKAWSTDWSRVEKKEDV